MSVVTHRRALHQIPELSRDLPKTTAYVEQVLAELPCEIMRPFFGAVCAFFDCGKTDTVAFRADMDALPLKEATGLPFASRHPGNMHACGHDGHTAIALSLAERVAKRLDKLPHNVLFVFQPAEETIGGAEELCSTGIFQKYHVIRVFGLHLWPDLPAGTVWTRPGPMMARSSQVGVIIEGRSVHISRAREGLDALWAGCEFLRRAYRLTDELPGEMRVLKFGKMTSGNTQNAISGQTELHGSLRSFDDETFEGMKSGLEAIVGQLTEETGCRFDLQISPGYPPTRNDAALLSAVDRWLGDAAPGSLAEPTLASEDFSFYQRQVPGVFFFLGLGGVPPLHSVDFSFDDEAILPAGVDFLEKLAEMP